MLGFLFCFFDNIDITDEHIESINILFGLSIFCACLFWFLTKDFIGLILLGNAKV